MRTSGAIETTTSATSVPCPDSSNGVACWSYGSNQLPVAVESCGKPAAEQGHAVVDQPPEYLVRQHVSETQSANRGKNSGGERIAEGHRDPRGCCGHHHRRAALDAEEDRDGGRPAITSRNQNSADLFGMPELSRKRLTHQTEDVHNRGLRGRHVGLIQRNGSRDFRRCLRAASGLEHEGVSGRAHRGKRHQEKRDQ